MIEIKRRINNKDYIIRYRALPKFDNYDGLEFNIESGPNYFTYTVKITKRLWEILVKQNIISKEEAAKTIIDVFIQYVFKNLEEGIEKDCDFIFTTKEMFIQILEQVKMPKKGNREIQLSTILKYLYDIHYQLFNKDDIPVSLRILSDDLGMDQMRVKDLLLSLEDEGKIKIIDHGNKNIFARISHKGIEEIEK